MKKYHSTVLIVLFLFPDKYNNHSVSSVFLNPADFTITDEERKKGMRNIQPGMLLKQTK